MIQKIKNSVNNLVISYFLTLDHPNWDSKLFNKYTRLKKRLSPTFFDIIKKKSYELYQLQNKVHQPVFTWENREKIVFQTAQFQPHYVFQEGDLQFELNIINPTFETKNESKKQHHLLILNENDIVSYDKEITIIFHISSITENLEELAGKNPRFGAILKYNLSRITQHLKTTEFLAKHIENLSDPNNFKEEISKNLELFLKRQRIHFIYQDFLPTQEKALKFFLRNTSLTDFLLSPNLSNSELSNSEERLTTKIAFFINRNVWDICQKIIDWISPIEVFRTKIWKENNHPSKENYLISLKLIPSQFYQKIYENSQQIQFWQENLLQTTSAPSIVKFFDLHDYLEFGDNPLELVNLPLDTSFFNKDFTKKIMDVISNNHKRSPIYDGMIIHGDNYQALSYLKNYFAKSVKCIYIDPPYNTRNTSFHFHDKFEDETWLTMMENRLLIAKDIMCENGVIFVSIDNYELSNLLKLMEEIFGKQNFIENFLWTKTSTPPSLSVKSRRTTEYVVCFEKKKSSLKYKGSLKSGEDAPLLNRGNPYQTITFPPKSIKTNLNDGSYPKGTYGRTELLSEAIVEKGTIINETQMRFESKWSQDTISRELKNGTELIIKSQKFSIRYFRKNIQKFNRPKNYLSSQFLNSHLSSTDSSIGTNETATKELQSIGIHFPDYPKPLSLVEKLVSFVTDGEDLILDFFAGSGTTGHAVMNLNQNPNNKAQRRFILVEVSPRFDETLKKRIVRRLYALKWEHGNPEKLEPEPRIIKYLTFPSFFDRLTSLRDEEITFTEGNLRNLFK
jgi:DNA modification methylase